jgi:hypothetical protein
MAFCGIISLSGIEVRNAIILIDHTNELLRRVWTFPLPVTGKEGSDQFFLLRWLLQ